MFRHFTLANLQLERKMPTLADFLESLTQENEKLIQMGTIIKLKDKSLAAGVSNKSQIKNKYLKQKEKEKN